MGIRLPCGNNNGVEFGVRHEYRNGQRTYDRGRAIYWKPSRRISNRQHDQWGGEWNGESGEFPAECMGYMRHARECHGMVSELVRGGAVRYRRSSWGQYKFSPRRAWWRVERYRLGLSFRKPHPCHSGSSWNRRWISTCRASAIRGYSGPSCDYCRGAGIALNHGGRGG